MNGLFGTKSSYLSFFLGKKSGLSGTIPSLLSFFSEVNQNEWRIIGY